MLALVSEFNCFLRSRCSMEMWCPDDIGRDSWDWVGPPAWVRACFNSPEWGGGSSPVKTEPPQIVLLLLLFQCWPEACVCPHRHVITRGKSTVFAQFATQSCLCATTGISTTVEKLHLPQLHALSGPPQHLCRRLSMKCNSGTSTRQHCQPRNLSLHRNGSSRTLSKNCTEES